MANVCVVFDGDFKDQSAPKDDKRPVGVLGAAARSLRGTRSHYSLENAPHRSRGPIHARIKRKVQQALDGLGIAHIEVPGEAELAASHLARRSINGFRVLVTTDAKNATNLGRCPIVVDIREVNRAWKAMFIAATRQGLRVSEAEFDACRRKPSRIEPNPLFMSTQVSGAVSHTFTWEPALLAAALGIEQSSLGLMLALHRMDDEPDHPLSYGQFSSFHTFQHAINELERIVQNLNDVDDFPCVLSVLVAYVEGDERVVFSDDQDRFWSGWFGGSWDVRTDCGRAKRAYAYTVLIALWYFQEDGPRRYYDQPATWRRIERDHQRGAPAGPLGRRPQAHRDLPPLPADRY